MFPTPQGGRRRQRPQQQFSHVEDSFSDEGVVEAVLTRSGGARGQVWAPHWSVAVHATDIRSSADGTFPEVDDHAETRRGALWPNLAILALVVAIACAVGVVLGGGGEGRRMAANVLAQHLVLRPKTLYSCRNPPSSP